MKLYAISDLHVGHPPNRVAVESLTPRPEDWLILGGDLGETFEHFDFVIETLRPRFKQLIWVPGNHELYVHPLDNPKEPRGEERYFHYIERCKQSGILTPEDPYPIWEGEGGPHLLVPMFLLYDYSFRPDEIPVEQAVEWAAEAGIAAADEIMIDPRPYPSRSAWCHTRVAHTEKRLEQAPALPKVLINHFPLSQDRVILPRVPRFSPWCGTRKTTHWPKQFNASIVVSGHLHVHHTVTIDGVRYEEVSFGYPRERRPGRTIEQYITQILPHPAPPQLT